jgi:hypothetical protein
VVGGNGGRVDWLAPGKRGMPWKPLYFRVEGWLGPRVNQGPPLNRRVATTKARLFRFGVSAQLPGCCAPLGIGCQVEIQGFDAAKDCVKIAR